MLADSRLHNNQNMDVIVHFQLPNQARKIAGPCNPTISRHDINHNDHIEQENGNQSENNRKKKKNKQVRKRTPSNLEMELNSQQ